MAAANPIDENRLKVDPQSGSAYYKISDRKVAYSIDVDGLVIADFDDGGNVRGLEFIDGKKFDEKSIHRYIALAMKNSKGSPPPR